MIEKPDQSGEACPRCGAHRLALIEFPDVPVMGVQVNSELLGMGELHEAAPPGIGCLACGAEWRDLAAFRATQGEGGGPA